MSIMLHHLMVASLILGTNNKTKKIIYQRPKLLVTLTSHAYWLLL